MHVCSYRGNVTVLEMSESENNVSNFLGVYWCLVGVARVG